MSSTAAPKMHVRFHRLAREADGNTKPYMAAQAMPLRQGDVKGPYRHNPKDDQSEIVLHSWEIAQEEPSPHKHDCP